jgi:methionine-rich copper-binding protein CopC
MHPYHRSPRRRRTALVLAALTIPTSAALATAPGASAHAQLVSTTPGAGASGVAPTAVVLTFDDKIVAVGDKILLTGPDGVVPGSLTVTGRVVTQTLTGAVPAGAYTVQWRVVSDDGHPVSGQFAFTATTSATAAPSATPLGAGATAGTSSAAPSASASAASLTTSATPPTAAAGSSRTGELLVGGLVVVAVLCGVAIVRARRGRDGERT